MKFSSIREPHVAGAPFMTNMSLSAMGMPWSVPLRFPEAISFSAARASSSALSARTVT